MAWLPAIGAGVGAASGAAALGVAHVTSHALAVATAFALSLLLTGAVHVDGFLDACDALCASVEPSRRLAILKDPSHGTFALAGAAVVATLALAALATLPVRALPLVLACAACAGRWAAIVHLLHPVYARAEATPAFARAAPLTGIAAGAALALALAALLGVAGIAALFAAIAVAAAALGWARARLGGGLVGDAYGFAIVLAEVAALVTAAVLLPRLG